MAESIRLKSIKKLGNEIVVDRENGLIKNISIITQGEALGHGFEIDGTMLSQVNELLNGKATGVKANLTHAHAENNMFSSGVDGITTLVGKFSNGRIEQGQVRGDFKLGKYAKSSPQGDMWTYLLDLAEEQPEDIGLSIVFVPGKFEQRQDSRKQSLPPAGRVKELVSVDFVGTPAANPNGLLSQNSKEKGRTMEDLELKLAKEKADAELAVEVERLKKLRDKLAGEAKELEVKEQAKALVLAEKTRQKEIRALGTAHEIEAETLNSWLDNDEFSLADANAEVLKILAKRNKPPVVNVKTDNNEQAALKIAIPQAIQLRAGAEVKDAHELAGKWKHMRLHEMTKRYFRLQGVPDVDDLSPSRLWELLNKKRFRETYSHIGLAQGTSDFGSILADTMGKTFRQKYEEKPKTWTQWARRATAPDFRTISRTYLSEMPTLTPVAEGGEVQYVTLSDGKETYALKEYKGGLIFTRRAFINDDMDAFSRIPGLEADAAARVEDDVTYAVLTGNAAMNDTVALFHADHDNVIASGGAPSVAQLTDMHLLFGLQTGPKGVADLNLTIKHLIVPKALEIQTLKLIGSPTDPASSNSNVPNPFANRFNVVADPRLDRHSAVKWYAAADHNQIDTVEVCFLADEPEPVMAQETDFDTDDVKFKTRHQVAAKAIDHRGLAYNAGQ
jgi:hypothetical protein